MDYIFIDEKNLADKIKYLAPVGAKDHVGLICKVRYKNIDPPLTKTTGKEVLAQRLYSNALHLIEIDWKTELKGKSIQEIWNFICDKYNESVDKFVPSDQKEKIKIYIEQNIKIHQRKKLSFQHMQENRTQRELHKMQESTE